MSGRRTTGWVCVRMSAWLLAACCAAFTTPCASTATAQTRSHEPTLKALLVSDIHFEPFADPDKAAKLALAPVGEWKAILAGPESPGRAERFAALEQTCHTRGEDTTFTLLESSLRAIRADAANARFVTVSGDLISHAFTCKFGAVFPHAATGDYRAFVEKTIAFVVGSVRETLPGIPVYVALGNNDSDCGDYQLDANGEFLAAMGKVMAADLPEAEKKQAEADFAAGGYFSATLPAPIAHTRLLVLDDLFMSRRYATCGGKEDGSAAEAQIAWLAKQLDEARRSKEHVWVMAHIPPGVDAYATVSKGLSICAGKAPTMFLKSEELPETLAKYGGVIQLVIFAHTHMDEMRLLEPEKGGAEAKGVAVKMVASISPINGNNPSFTVAKIDAATGVLKDYSVIAASNQTGINATWSEEYDFAQAYKEPDFTATSLKSLIAAFDADHAAQTSASQSYIHNYGTGMAARELSLFWPQYICALKNDAGEALPRAFARR